MNINIIFFSTFFIAYFIFYLIKNDLKDFKIKLYTEINNKAWIKIYSLISIALIHFTWIFSILFLKYKDDNLLFGFTPFLFIPYMLYIITDFKNENINTIASQKINKYLNYLISIYFIILIIWIIISNTMLKT